MAQEIPIEELQKGVQAVTWQHGLLSACVLLGSIVVAKAAGRIVRWAFSRNVRGAAFAFSKLLTYALIFAGMIGALSLLGMPRSSLVLTSSALLVGVGFSLQPVARDVIAGIVILVEQSIRKHDFVSFGSTMGTVQEIGARNHRQRGRLSPGCAGGAAAGRSTGGDRSGRVPLPAHRLGQRAPLLMACRLRGAVGGSEFPQPPVHG